jgi:hypothetical protein
VAPTVTQALLAAAAAANAMDFRKSTITFSSFRLRYLVLLNPEAFVNEHIDTLRFKFCATSTTFACPSPNFYVLFR